MKWNKTSEQLPRTGTYCLCKRRNNYEYDFAVAKYENSGDAHWIVFDPGKYNYAFRDVYYYYRWIPIAEIDKELNYEVD